ncbi:MAG TPA: riboflavin synthase [Halanaerobiales bacterium]|nr:riboflavin synthase [Halanaerobiales bacterium]
MFTGIVMETGELKRKISSSNKYQLQISANKVLEGIKNGDSIAVNGVCLTVVKNTASSFTADVMPGTLNATNLSNLQRGDPVNLEQAVKADSFMGGHIVTGHIDGTGKVLNIKKEDNAKLVELAIDDNLMQYMVEKGSVSLNGVSLTIYKLKEESLIVSLIPETVSETNLKDVKVGSVLNIEADIIGKYVNKMLGKMGMTDKKDDNKNSGLDKEFLKENGFL